MLKKTSRRSREGSLGDWVKQSLKSASMNIGMMDEPASEDDLSQSFVQWTTSDDKAYFPASRSVKALCPGVYEIKPRGDGTLYFCKIPTTTEGLIKFPETTSQTVVNEIDTFWNTESDFKDYELAFKRGILLYGPPGSGKTCTIKLAVNDIISKRNGIVVKFCHPNLFSEGMRIFREIQPKTPVITLMEDIDAIIESYNESDVINVLDGVDMVEKIVFIATTNYPEKLGERVMNRPSRFDKRFYVGMPNEESRKIYLEALVTKGKKKSIDIGAWVTDTEGFSIAHLKELFVAVEILGNKYATALATLKSMIKEKISSDTYGAKMDL